MSADTRQDYTIDEVALWKADIDPRVCNGSVRCAIDRQLSGYDKAESYLEQLWEQIEAGILTPSRVVPPPESGGGLIVIGLDEFYLSAEDAESWQPDKSNPLRGSKHNTNNVDVSNPVAALLIIGLLTNSYYEDKERGGQTVAMRTIQSIADQLGIPDKNLSEATIKRYLKAAREKLKESSI